MIRLDVGDLICFKVEDGGWESEVLLGVVVPPSYSEDYDPKQYFIRVRAMHGSTYIISRSKIISNLSKTT
tara:strand:- start:4349 stop:4558 length:210 start_codon:yes stop_codon:yes gene_type:complete